MKVIAGYIGKELDFEEYFLVSIRPGWRPLVRELVDDIVAMGWNKVLYDVKEKFGGLRFYVASATEEVLDRIEEAENRSYTICQECGEPGELWSCNGWYVTLCEAHAKERKCVKVESRRKLKCLGRRLKPRN